MPYDCALGGSETLRTFYLAVPAHCTSVSHARGLPQVHGEGGQRPRWLLADKEVFNRPGGVSGDRNACGPPARRNQSLRSAAAIMNSMPFARARLQRLAYVLWPAIWARKPRWSSRQTRLPERGCRLDLARARSGIARRSGYGFIAFSTSFAHCREDSRHGQSCGRHDEALAWRDPPETRCGTWA